MTRLVHVVLSLVALPFVKKKKKVSYIFFFFLIVKSELSFPFFFCLFASPVILYFEP